MAGFDQEAQRVFDMQADMLRVLANAKRLMIMAILGEGPRTVSEIAAALNMSLQNTSQHLRVMKDQGIVAAQRESQTVKYCLTNSVFNDACKLVREAMTHETHKKGRDLERAGNAPTRDKKQGEI